LRDDRDKLSSILDGAELQAQSRRLISASVQSRPGYSRFKANYVFHRCSCTGAGFFVEATKESWLGA
jgi:hypothetical protein